MAPRNDQGSTISAQQFISGLWMYRCHKEKSLCCSHCNCNFSLYNPTCSNCKLKAKICVSPPATGFSSLQDLLVKLADRLHSSSSDQESFRTKISIIGGLPLAVIETLLSRKTNRSVQAAGCRALLNLAVDCQGRTSILECGALPMVIEAMRNYPQDKAIQHCGYGLLHNLLCKTDEKLEAAGDNVLKPVAVASNYGASNGSSAGRKVKERMDGQEEHAGLIPKIIFQRGGEESSSLSSPDIMREIVRLKGLSVLWAAAEFIASDGSDFQKTAVASLAEAMDYMKKLSLGQKGQ